MKPMILALLAVAACSSDKPSAAPGGGRAGPGGGRGPVNFPVEVEPVTVQTVEYTVSAVGSVEAYERVQVTARVGGAVERVLFTEGDTVKAGQVLVEIEPKRYQVAVRSARATLEKAEAARADAAAAVARREAALSANPGLIPGEELETYRTRVRTAAADAAQARATLEQAQLNLRDAYVRAPVAGVIETRTVQTGQYLQPGAVLATLVRRDPLLLRFQVSEPDAAVLRAGMDVRFRLRNEEREMTARVAHVGQAANVASRMVQVTAEIPADQAAALRPGAFAEVTIPVGRHEAAPVIAQTAVRPSEKGFLAYVVEGGVARERTLSLGMRTSDGRVEVRAGLRAGERLVIRGAEALRDGSPVRVAGEGAKGGPAARPAVDGGGAAPRSSP